MECMLKRLLPFLLTLIIGIGLSATASIHFLRSDEASRTVLPRNTTPLVINYAPPLHFTKESHKHGVSGQIRLQALLGADGKVSEIKPVMRLPYGQSLESIPVSDRKLYSPAMVDGKGLPSLPYGLTEVAIEAASQIQFTPATVNGKPVSVWVNINDDFEDAQSPDYVYPSDILIYSPTQTVIMESGASVTDADTILWPSHGHKGVF